MHVPGFGEIPQIWVETYGAYESFRRLGFKHDDLTFLVARNGDAGYIRHNVMHLVLQTQGKRFVYTVDVVPDPPLIAQQFLDSMLAAIAAGDIDDESLLALYRASELGSSEPSFQTLAIVLVSKGFFIPGIAN